MNRKRGLFEMGEDEIAAGRFLARTGTTLKIIYEKDVRGFPNDPKPDGLLRKKYKIVMRR